MRVLADRFGIPINDSELAKVGVLATLEAKAKFLIMATLKAAVGYNDEQFVEAEKLQLAQLTRRLLDIAPSIDAELHRLVEDFDRQRLASHEKRHKFVHALWGHGEAEAVVARDIRRQEMLSPAELDKAMDQVAQLADAAHACAFRAAELIVEGRLKEGQSRKPAMYLKGRWVNL